MNLLITCLLLISPVFSYPQNYQLSEEETESIENNSIKDSNIKIGISDVGKSGKLLKAIKVIPHYNTIPENYTSSLSSIPSTYIPIIRYDKHQSLDGSYKHSYETGNNIVAEETGFIKNPGVKDLESLVQHGSYKYIAPDGTEIFTSYTADEEGFKVEGSHLPTAPPMPEEIRKSLEKIYESIRLQQELEAREQKQGKVKSDPGNESMENSIAEDHSAQYSSRQKFTVHE